MIRSNCTKSILMLALMALCLAQGCPTSEETAGFTPGDGNTGGGSTDGGAGGIVIEPDDFEDGTALTNVNSAFTLTTALADNEIAETWEVTATHVGEDTAPTDELVFGHNDIGFFHTHRRLRIDFNGTGSSIQITYGAGSSLEAETGVLEAYDANGNLIAEDSTSPLVAGETEVLSVSATGIAWAVAYTPDGSFGRLDRLVVSAN